MNAIEVARVIFEKGWNGNDFTQARQVMADEFSLHVNGATRTTNAAEFEDIVNTWRASFPDFHFDLHSITADEHIAAVRATFRGTHRGSWGGLEPTGRSVAVEHAFFLRFEDGVVVEVWEILDPTAFRRQLTEDQP